MYKLVLDKTTFWQQFFPNTAATLIGVILGGLTTLAIVYWQLRRESQTLFVSTLRTLFSEFQENERTLRQGEPLELTASGKVYRFLLTYLSASSIRGALSSERLGLLGHHKLTASLVLLERKVLLHNRIVDAVFEAINNLQQPSYNRDQPNVVGWLSKNLNEKQRILREDFINMMDVVRILEDRKIKLFLIPEAVLRAYRRFFRQRGG